MRILITGGCGFIGTNLAKYLINKGYQVRILDNLSIGYKFSLFDAGIKLQTGDFIIGNICNLVAMTRALKDIDAVVHLAAFTKVIESIEHPNEVWHTNLSGTINVLEACKQSGVKKVIFASSNASLGNYMPPFHEGLVPEPISPMGASKAACEAICSAYWHCYDIETTCLRFSNCYGLYSKHKTSVISKFIKQLMQGKPLTIYGDGEQSRDFINADDVCQAIELCVRQNHVGGVYQIASGIETTINTLTEMMMGISGIDVNIIYEPERKGEIKRNCSNISKARGVLNYAPRIELKQGLIDLWKWHNA